MANPVFKAICDNDISALQMLLGSQRSYVRMESSVRSVSHNAAKNSLSNHTDQRSGRPTSTATNKNEHDNLAIQFFMHTDSEDLKKLIQISQARCFNFILHACTSHTRYQLAKVGALDGLIRYLAFKQLEIFIDELIKGGIGMYRDHVAILHIAQALSERCFQNSDENQALRTMIKHILDRALQHHHGRNNRRVVSKIKEYLNDFEQNKAQAMPESEIFENLMAHESVPLHIELAGFDPQGIEEDTNPYENNEAEPSIQSYSSSYTSTFFALPKVTVPRMAGAIEDVNYLYTSEDIQAILPKQMAQLEMYKPELSKQLHLLACVNLDPSAAGNRITDVLQSLIQVEEIDALKGKIFIMPIHYHNHWVGIRFETNSQGIFSFTFYDSLKDEPRRRQISQEAINSFHQFNSDYFRSTLIPKIQNFSCLQQQDGDGVSCGVLVIENIYKDLRGEQWERSNARTEDVSKFREFHRSLLEAPRQNYNYS